MTSAEKIAALRGEKASLENKHRRDGNDQRRINWLGSEIQRMREESVNVERIKMLDGAMNCFKEEV